MYVNRRILLSSHVTNATQLHPVFRAVARQASLGGGGLYVLTPNLPD